jgi:hypothetical protein
MTDIRAADRSPLDDDDRLPWLEAVEEPEERDGPSLLKLIVAVLIGLAAIGGIVGGLFWFNSRGTDGGGNGELIKAPEGPYKVAPTDPGGMTVEGEGDSAFAATQGADQKGSIDTSAVPEAPVTPGGGGKSAPSPNQPLIPAPAPSNVDAPASGGGTIQLGAFSSQAAANSAWSALSGRFRYLSPLTHSVVPVTSGGKTLYRLRASGPGAPDLCGRLRVAGEKCVSVN